MQRQHDWLSEHSANLTRGSDPISDFAGVSADWSGARSEIEAIERHLKRTGQPVSAPPGWAKGSENTGDPATEAASQAFMNYMNSLVEQMRTSSDKRKQALGIGEVVLSEFDNLYLYRHPY